MAPLKLKRKRCPDEANDPLHAKSRLIERRLPKGFSAVGASGKPPIRATTTSDVGQRIPSRPMVQDPDCLGQSLFGTGCNEGAYEFRRTTSGGH
jgi:hypothetical protein